MGRRDAAWDDVLMSDLAAQSESLGTSIRRDQARTPRHDAALHGKPLRVGLRGCSTSEVPQLLIYPPNTRIRIMGTSGSAASSSDDILNCLVPNYRSSLNLYIKVYVRWSERFHFATVYQKMLYLSIYISDRTSNKLRLPVHYNIFYIVLSTLMYLHFCRRFFLIFLGTLFFIFC